MALVASSQGRTLCVVFASNESARATGSSSDTPVSASRNASAWSMPMVAPRPSDGLVHAQESPTATTPVVTGAPSTTELVIRSSIFDIDRTPSSIGSASAQCAISGHESTTRCQTSGSMSARSGASIDRPMTPTIQVLLSAGRVRMLKQE